MATERDLLICGAVNEVGYGWMYTACLGQVPTLASDCSQDMNLAPLPAQLFANAFPIQAVSGLFAVSKVVIKCHCHWKLFIHICRHCLFSILVEYPPNGGYQILNSYPTIPMGVDTCTC